MSRLLRGPAGHCWTIEHQIGCGSFATVWKARDVNNGQVAAVKEICTDKLNEKLKESLASEIHVLERTRHKNIVSLLDLIKEEGRIYLVLEYCGGGDLAHYLRRYGRVPESTAWYLLHQLAEGLKMLRMNNLIHRDLKPQNLLLSDNSRQPVLKIADFGFARNLQPQGLAETLCGSPLYMAPEILQFTKYDAKADLWSVGTILFELLTGKPPFNGANHLQLLQNIERGEGGRLPDALAAQLSAPCKQLLHQLLRRNPVERIGFEEFFAHPFLASPPPVPPPSPAPLSQPNALAASYGTQRASAASPAAPTPSDKGLFHAQQQGAAQEPHHSSVSSVGHQASGSPRPLTPDALTQPVQPLGAWMGVDQATGIVVRHVMPSRPATNSPPPQAAATLGGPTAVPSSQVTGSSREQQTRAIPTQLPTTSLSSGVGPGTAAPGPLSPFSASTVGHDAAHLTYTDVDLGPAHIPSHGEGHHLPDPPGQPSAIAGPALRTHDSFGHDEDYVVITSDGSRSGSESGRGPNSFSGRPRGSAGGAGSTGTGAGSTGAGAPGSLSTTPVASQAQSLMRQMSRGLGRLGPALLQPRLVAAATQQLRGVVSGMSMAQSTSNVARAGPGAWPGEAGAAEKQGTGRVSQPQQRAQQQNMGSNPGATPAAAEIGAPAAKGVTNTTGPVPSPMGSSPATAGVAGGAQGVGKTPPGLQISPEWVMSLAQLPENVDSVDLLQRVLHILLDTGRARWESALAAAELAAETAAAHAAASAAAAGTQHSHSSGGAAVQAEPPSPATAAASQTARKAPAAGSTQQSEAAPGQNGGAEGQRVEREKEREKAGGTAGAAMAAASAAAAQELEPAAAELLSLHLFCARLLDAALVSGAADPSSHPHAASMLVSHARALLTGGGEHVRAAMARLPQDMPLPRGSDAVYEAALRCCRAGAAEELLGQYHASVEQYAKAADLLLFLLSELAPVAAVKPQLCAADAARVHKYYAAVKMRQRACMAMLNAQLPASAAV